MTTTDTHTMKQAITPARINPFTSKPRLSLTAPTGAQEMNQALQLGVNLNSGAMSLKKRDVLRRAAVKLVGERGATESAESWINRAQAALNARFA